MRVSISTLCALALVSGTVPAQKPELPKIVRSGLEAYRRGGVAFALKVWSQDSPIASQFGGDVQQGFEKIEGTYGHMVGYDVLDVVSFGPHVTRSYVVLLYESGPAYIWFDCYKKTDRWVVTAFLYNARPDVILPAGMFHS